LTTTQILFEGVKTGAPIASAAVKQAVNGLLESILRHPAASLLLVQMRQFDPTLLTHSVDVCVLSLVVGKERELTLDQLRILGAGALLHDIGHLRLPRNLRWQPHSYTPQQRKLLRAHPHLGVAILAQTLGITEDSREIVATHHERVNGSGYPEGRRAAEIPRLSQIVAIADTYDKLVSGWTGQPGLPPTSALRHLYQQGRAGLFDDKQIALTIRAFGVYPVGTLVELNTGERAVVLSLNPHETLRPTVRIITTREPQSPRGAQIVDLATQIDGAPIRSIVRALEPTTAQIKLGDYF
jgi:HD-GYP domain-containing protein (c-di-GMP phosphodiesterase class II)